MPTAIASATIAARSEHGPSGEPVIQSSGANATMMKNAITAAHTANARPPSTIAPRPGRMTSVGIDKRFTIHGLRYTFTDLVRLANVDAVVRRALTGHVTEEMQRHYSTVGLDEKRAAVAGVLRLVPPETGSNPTSPTEGGVSGGVSESGGKAAG